MGGLFFLVATPYHVIPYNFRLLFHSSIYSAVYSWFFLINMMKTGIGQSKYCVPQPFSRCLISLCSSLFYFNSIYVVVNFLSQVILIFLLFQLLSIHYYTQKPRETPEEATSVWFWGNLLAWLETYPHNRSQRVTILGVTSSPLL